MLEKDKICEMYARGISNDYITKHFNISLNMMYKIVKEAGLPLKREKSAQINKIRQLFALGFTADEIYRRTGYNKDLIQAIVKKYSAVKLASKQSEDRIKERIEALSKKRAKSNKTALGDFGKIAGKKEGSSDTCEAGEETSKGEGGMLANLIEANKKDEERMEKYFFNFLSNGHIVVEEQREDMEGKSSKDKLTSLDIRNINIVKDYISGMRFSDIYKKYRIEAEELFYLLEAQSQINRMKELQWERPKLDL